MSNLKLVAGQAKIFHNPVGAVMPYFFLQLWVGKAPTGVWEH
jgi:hypothetical protein